MVQKWTIGLILLVLLLGVVSYGAANLILYAVEKTEDAHAPARFLKDEAPAIRPTQTAFQAPKGLEVMVPHRATYRIDMVQKRSSAQIVDLSGTMTFEWKSVCDAWVTDHRFDLVYIYPEAPPMKIQSDFVTYEPHDGSTFDFNSRRRREGELYEELRGTARIDSTKKGGQVDYTVPEGLSYDLPPGTIFPMRHAFEVLQAIAAGKMFYKVTIFDGSDDQGPVEVNSFIGPEVDALSVVTMNDALDTSLIESPARRVRLAFFPLNTSDPQADYEMDVLLHPNGVISDMRVQYEDFSVTQRLVALERLESADPCAKRALAR
jgi:hypothetical protein